MNLHTHTINANELKKGDYLVVSSNGLSVEIDKVTLENNKVTAQLFSISSFNPTLIFINSNKRIQVRREEMN